MLKRTIVVLATLAMLIGLLPAVAVAGAADVTDVQVTLVDENSDAVDVVWNLYLGDADDVLAGYLNNDGFDYDSLDLVASGMTGDTDPSGTLIGDSADLPQDGDAAIIELYWENGYGIMQSTWLYVTLVDGDDDGEVQFDLAYDFRGALEGDFDANASKGGVSAHPAVWSGGAVQHTLNSDTEIEMYGFTVAPGTYGVSAVKDDSEGSYPDGNPFTDNDTVDNGELMVFDSKASAGEATPVNVPVDTTIEDVDFEWENKSNLDPDVFDHAESGPFADMAGNFAEEDAAQLNALGYVEGCDTTPNFCPDDGVTRAEFAATIGRILTGDTYPVVVTPPFPDVPTDYWAAGWIQYLVDLKDPVVEGDSDGNFNPDEVITRAEAAAMIARWLTGPWSCGYDDIEDLPAPTLSFIDVPTTHWAAAEISYLYDLGVVQGNTDGTFGPSDPITRAEFAAMVWRAWEECE